jgi:hypothetical protein
MDVAGLLAGGVLGIFYVVRLAFQSLARSDAESKPVQDQEAVAAPAARSGVKPDAASGTNPSNANRAGTNPNREKK